ncbi:hypothetical protein [Acutalibacter intestini]|uniref:hypothetical protein n=1 Tax=Acutalibacter intestini TaxID=3093659 RepID=UPI002AC8DAD1|nr:hypothetical protein [Acutalibacter sp. M00204]
MEIEILSYPDDIWEDILEQAFDTAGFAAANTLAGVLSREDLDLYSILYIADEIRKLADHFHNFIIMDEAQNYTDVGEYIAQHERGYQIGEYMDDFADYSKLGEYIARERDGMFMGSCFICMEDRCDLETILHGSSLEIELGGCRCSKQN